MIHIQVLPIHVTVVRANLMRAELMRPELTRPELMTRLSLSLSAISAGDAETIDLPPISRLRNGAPDDVPSASMNGYSFIPLGSEAETFPVGSSDYSSMTPPQ